MDLYIPEIFINPRNEVYLILKNQGHTDIDQRHIDLSVTWDDTYLIHIDLDTVDPHFRNAQDSSILRLPFIPVSSAHRVAARVDSLNVVLESDEYHNVYLKTLSTHFGDSGAPFQYPPTTASFDPEAYHRLMAQVPFSNLMLWYEDHKIYPLAYWRKAWKDQLIQEIENIYLQTPFTLPDSLSYSYHREEAFSIFLHYLAHSLYLEKEKLVPWSVFDFSADDLSGLWDARQYFEWDSLYQVYRLSYEKSGAFQVRHPLIAYQFSRFLQGRPEHISGSLEHVMDWGRAYLLHTERSGSTIFQSPVDILYPQTGQSHAVYSCWATSGLILDYCRALNIPVKRHNIDLYNGTHSQIEFPSEGWYLVHADDMYEPLYYPVHNPIPATQALFNKSEMNNLHRKKPLCIEDSCQSKGTQMSYDRRRAILDQAATLGSGYYLLQYDQGKSKFREFIRGDQFEVFLAPLYTADEEKVQTELIKKMNPDYKFIQTKYQRFEAAKNNRR